MKKIIYILLIALSINSTTAQNTNADKQSKWEQANKLYQNDEYTTAILLYEELLNADQHSAQIYYNLGNAYFKNNNLGKAILNYNRALLLDPSDEDIQHNLMIANARTIDKIEPTPQFFIKTWLVDFGGIFSSDTWAILSLVFLGTTLFGVTLWLISTTLPIRKLGFYCALISVVITITSVIYSQSAYNKQTSQSQAIIMNSGAPVKSSPSASGKDLFLLHEGTKVEILNTMDHWDEIVLEDGNKGWIQQSALERINQ